MAVIDNLSTGFENLNSRSAFFKADITDRVEVEKVFADFRPGMSFITRADRCSTFRFRSRLRCPGEHRGSINILEACRLHGARKWSMLLPQRCTAILVTCQSMKRHPIAPSAPYGISSIRSNTICRSIMISMTYHMWLCATECVRAAPDPKGEGGVVAIFTDRLLNGEGVRIFGDGEQTRILCSGDIARLTCWLDLIILRYHQCQQWQ